MRRICEGKATSNIKIQREEDPRGAPLRYGKWRIGRERKSCDWIICDG